jgi:hypothetical protein
LDFSSILVYGALGVFAIFILAILIPLMFSLFNDDDEKNITDQKKGPPPSVAKSTQFFVELDRSASGEFVVPDNEPPPTRSKPVVVNIPGHTRERYLDTSQPQQRNHRKSWENHWR